MDKTIGKRYTSFAEMEADEDAFYANLTPNERLRMGTLLMGQRVDFTIGKRYTSFAEMEADEDAFYANLTPIERLQIGAF